MDELPEEGWLRAYLADRDVPCPQCWYNIRGLTGSFCPECGEELRLVVGLTEPRVGEFVAGLVGLSSGLGFSCLVFLWGLANRAPDDDLLRLGASAAVEATAIWAWVVSRRRMRRRDRTSRLLFVAGCWGLTGVLAVWFFADL